MTHDATKIYEYYPDRRKRVQGIPQLSMKEERNKFPNGHFSQPRPRSENRYKLKLKSEIRVSINS